MRKTKYKYSDNLLIDLLNGFYLKGMSSEALAKQYGVTSTFVRSVLKGEQRLEVKTLWESKHGKHDFDSFKRKDPFDNVTKAQVKKLLAEGLNCVQIAESLGYTGVHAKAAGSRIISKFGLSANKRKKKERIPKEPFDEKVKRIAKEKGITKEVLKTLHVKECLSIQQIADKFEVKHCFIGRLLRKYRLKKSKTPILDTLDMQWVLKCYNEDVLSESEIAKRIGVSRDTIRAALARHKVVKRDRKRTVEVTKHTWVKTYGHDNPSKDPGIKKIISEKATERLLNNPYNGSSNSEREIYEWLKEIYPEALLHYWSDEYPFICDFYVPSEKLYIEFQGYPTHGKEPYDPSKHKEVTKYSETFKEKDRLKRTTAERNGLQFLELWWSDYMQGKEWVKFLLCKGQLPINIKTEYLGKELTYISNKDGSTDPVSSYNSIVLHYQKHFYKKERSLWNNPFTRNKLIENRVKYLGKPKELITNRQYLAGFKISGAHIGFSHFNPLIVKYFVEKYNVKSIYDPCAGWGHRLLGAAACGIEYTATDTDKQTVLGLKNMIKDLELKNCKVYNCKAESFKLKNTYDAIFTCPPYFTTEMYSGKNTSTSLYPKYKEWLNIWWRSVVQNSLTCSPKVFAFVTSVKLSKDMIRVCEQERLTLVESNTLQARKSHLAKSKKAGEVLLVFST